MALALLGVGAGALVYQSQRAMAAPTVSPEMESRDDQYQDGISLQAWQQSVLTQAGNLPPLQTQQMTEPTHPGGDPYQILNRQYYRYEFDVTNNTGHVIDHLQNAGDYIVIQDNSRRNVLLENDLSTQQRVWQGQKIDMQYKYADPDWASWGAQRTLAGGLNTPNQAGNFSGMNTYQ